MLSKLRCTSTRAWALLSLVLWFSFVASAMAETSPTGYSCTTNASGTITCSANTSNTGGDTGGDTSGGGSGGGWLTNITSWLGSAVASVVNAIRDIAKDFVVWIVKAVTDLFLMAVAAIGVPSFIANYSLASLLSNVSPILGFFVAQFKIGAALSLIGTGYAFRLLRKLLTLGQW